MQNESNAGGGALKGISEATAAEILAFRDDRQWMPFHNPKDLAMSVAIEAGELLEVFSQRGSNGPARTLSARKGAGRSPTNSPTC